MAYSSSIREQHRAGGLQPDAKEPSLYKTTSEDFAPLLNVSDVSSGGGRELAKSVDRREGHPRPRRSPIPKTWLLVAFAVGFVVSLIRWCYPRFSEALIGRLHHRRLAEGGSDNDGNDGGRSSPDWLELCLEFRDWEPSTTLVEGLRASPSMVKSFFEHLEEHQTPADSVRSANELPNVEDCGSANPLTEGHRTSPLLVEAFLAEVGDHQTSASEQGSSVALWSEDWGPEMSPTGWSHAPPSSVESVFNVLGSRQPSAVERTSSVALAGAKGWIPGEWLTGGLRARSPDVLNPISKGPAHQQSFTVGTWSADELAWSDTSIGSLVGVKRLASAPHDIDEERNLSRKLARTEQFTSLSLEGAGDSSARSTFVGSSSVSEAAEMGAAKMFFGLPRAFSKTMGTGAPTLSSTGESVSMSPAAGLNLLSRQGSNENVHPFLRVPLVEGLRASPSMEESFFEHLEEHQTPADSVRSANELPNVEDCGSANPLTEGHRTSPLLVETFLAEVGDHQTSASEQGSSVALWSEDWGPEMSPTGWSHAPPSSVESVFNVLGSRQPSAVERTSSVALTGAKGWIPGEWLTGGLRARSPDVLNPISKGPAHQQSFTVGTWSADELAWSDTSIGSLVGIKRLASAPHDNDEERTLSRKLARTEQFTSFNLEGAGDSSARSTFVGSSSVSEAAEMGAAKMFFGLPRAFSKTMGTGAPTLSSTGESVSMSPAAGPDLFSRQGSNENVHPILRVPPLEAGVTPRQFRGDILDDPLIEHTQVYTMFRLRGLLHKPTLSQEDADHVVNHSELLANFAKHSLALPVSKMRPSLVAERAVRQNWGRQPWWRTLAAHVSTALPHGMRDEKIIPTGIASWTVAKRGLWEIQRPVVGLLEEGSRGPWASLLIILRPLERGRPSFVRESAHFSMGGIFANRVRQVTKLSFPVFCNMLATGNTTHQGRLPSQGDSSEVQWQKDHVRLRLSLSTAGQSPDTATPSHGTSLLHEAPLRCEDA
ncbi:hypothetical protein Efla_006140 [Eimeria flavescens]